jgi:CRISPR-associated protein Cas1
MSTLYVIEPGSRLEKEYGRLLVTKDDLVLLRVPLKRVSQVVLVGKVGTTTQALHALLMAAVPLFLVSRSGKLLGRLIPPTSYNLPLRQAQYRRDDQADFALAVARQIVVAKIHNQAVLAKRLARRKPNISTKNIIRMENAMRSAEHCAHMDSLLGHEGSAANAYFEILKAALDPSWGFSRRSRRPPKDPVNALLSLGYTFLGYAITTALETVGLDPYLGYFHQEAYGRPALALDLIEEFRAPVVDALCLGLVNRRLLRARDFHKGLKEGVTLSQRGLRVFLREFEDRLETEITLPEIERPLSYRKLFEVQARKMAHLILGKAQTYQPFTWR